MIVKGRNKMGKDRLSATQAKNAKELFAAGGTLYESCDNCHRKYERVY